MSIELVQSPVGAINATNQVDSVRSGSKLKSLGLILRERKIVTLCLDTACDLNDMYHSSSMEEIRSIVVTNQDTHFKLVELGTLTSVGISRERTNQILHVLEERENIGYVTYDKYLSACKTERTNEAMMKALRRKSLDDEIFQMLKSGIGATAISRRLVLMGIPETHTLSIANRLRWHNQGAGADLPRLKRPRRNREEMEASDNQIKELFCLSLSYDEISTLTGLDDSQICSALTRLSRKGEVKRRPRGAKTSDTT